MNRKKYFKSITILVCALAAASLLQMCCPKPTPQVAVRLREGAGVTMTTLTFGNTPAGGCVGKGICKATTTSASDAIPVGFTMLNNNQVLMFFDMSLLKQEQRANPTGQ